MAKRKLTETLLREYSRLDASLTIQEVAEELGISRRSFYNYLTAGRNEVGGLAEQLYCLWRIKQQDRILAVEDRLVERLERHLNQANDGDLSASLVRLLWDVLSRRLERNGGELLYIKKED